MAGRRPKPTKLKLLQGTQRSGRINSQEPDPKSEIPSCPKHIQGESRREWKRITKELSALGLLTRIDRAAIAAYCEAYGRWVPKIHLIHTLIFFLLISNYEIRQASYAHIGHFEHLRGL
jgi:phage terminase small subunit